MGIINDAGYFILRFWDNPFAGDDKKNRSISSRRLELYEQRATFKAEEDKLIIAHDEAIEKNNRAKGNNFNKLLVGVAIAALVTASGVGIFALFGGTAATMLGAVIMAAGGYKGFRSVVDFSRESRRAQLELNKDLAAISAQRQTLDNIKNERLQNYANEVDNGNFVILQDKYNQITSRGKAINPRNPLSELMKEGSVTANGTVKYKLDSHELIATFGRRYSNAGRQDYMKGKLAELLDEKVPNKSIIAALASDFTASDKLDTNSTLKIGDTNFGNMLKNAALTGEQARLQQNIVSLKMTDGSRLNISLNVMHDCSSESAIEAAIFGRIMEEYYNRVDNNPSNNKSVPSLNAVVRDFELGLIKFETGDVDTDKLLAKSTREVVMEMVRAKAATTDAELIDESFKTNTYSTFVKNYKFKEEHNAQYNDFQSKYLLKLDDLKNQSPPAGKPVMYDASEGKFTPAGIKEIEKWLVAEGTKLHEEQGYSIQAVIKFMDSVSQDTAIVPSNDNTVNPLVAAAHAAAGRA